MRKIILISIFLFQAYACTGEATSVPSDSFCEGTGWIAFQDEKCFKLIEKYSSRADAENLCASEKSTLVTVKSLAEQIFLTHVLFTSLGIQNNVWLGVKRNSAGQFQWDDGEWVEKFTNWAPGSPTGEQERECAEMVGKFTRKGERTGEEGKWRDVNCRLGNFVVCEKAQQWTLEKLKKVTIGTRSELVETKQRLAKSESNLEELQQNPVPIGFIYVQLSNQPEPSTIWSNVEWKDVSSEYAGLFFRAEGGDAATFGSVQEGNAPRVTQVNYAASNNWDWSIQLPINGWSSGHGVYAGAYPGTTYHVHHFYTSGGEVRPRNTAIRIWKRVK